MPEPTPPGSDVLPGSSPALPDPDGVARPFAEIIETFRSIAEGGSPAQPEPVRLAPPEPTPTAAAEPPIEPTQAEPTPAVPAESPAPTRGWARPLRLAAVGLVLLALMAATGFYLAGRLPEQRATVGSTAEPAPVVPGRQYAGVLAAVAAADDLAGLSAAADEAYAASEALAAAVAGGPDPVLAAQAASLQSFSALDAVTPDNAVEQFPASAATIQAAAAAVTEALRKAGALDPASDPADAVANVVRLVAPLALDGLERRLTGLLHEAGAAELTADLRAVAEQARAARVTAEDTVAVLGGRAQLLARARALDGALGALAALRGIDGDHLDAWTPVRLSLTTDLTAAGMPTDAVEHIDGVVQVARQKMVAWAAALEVAGGMSKADVTAYSSRMGAALDRLAAAAAAVPPLVVTQPPSLELTARAFAAMGAVRAALGQVRKVEGVPDGLRAAHRRLLASLADAGVAAVKAHQVTVAAEGCTGCTLGDLPAWAEFSRARTALDGLTGVRATWQAAVDRASAEALDQALAPPPKPEV